MARPSYTTLTDLAVVGYVNPDFKRGSKGQGEWWIKRGSIDEYHEALSGEGAIKAALGRLGVV